MKSHLAWILCAICISISVEPSELLKNFQKGINPSFHIEYEGDPKYEHMTPIEVIDIFLEKEPIILEAGAHEGEDTLRFIKKWPDATIFAFEPNPRACNLMRERLKDLLQVRIFPYALDSTCCEKTFYLAQGPNMCIESEGASSLLPTSPEMKFHYQGDVISVNCVMLDDWCESEGVSTIDFMWLDMEGSELNALSKAKQILKTTRVVYTETNFQKFREGMAQYEDLKSFLEGKGFEVIAHWYIPEWQGNALFVKRELVYEID